MMKSSKSWMTEAESWLAAPCTYTTAKCLSSHVLALQVGTLNCVLSSLLPFLYTEHYYNVLFNTIHHILWENAVNVN